MALIPLGVDTSRFRPEPAAGKALRRQLAWDPTGPPVVGYLGRFVQAKGIGLMMRALEAVRSPWRALFVGAGPMEAELTEWARHFPDRVRICTDVRHDDVPRYLNAMDVMCAPSQTTSRWREQFGRMLIEAFACGISVIGSDSGEIPYVLRDTGKVVGENDVPGWTNALGEFLDNPGLRKHLGEMGRERVMTEFDWPVIGRKHVAFFNSLLSRSE